MEKDQEERPRMRWQDNIQRDLESLGVQNMETAAQDRTVWRRIVREGKTHKGLKRPGVSK